MTLWCTNAFGTCVCWCHLQLKAHMRWYRTLFRTCVRLNPLAPWCSCRSSHLFLYFLIFHAYIRCSRNTWYWSEILVFLLLFFYVFQWCSTNLWIERFIQEARQHRNFGISFLFNKSSTSCYSFFSLNMMLMLRKLCIELFL